MRNAIISDLHICLFQAHVCLPVLASVFPLLGGKFWSFGLKTPPARRCLCWLHGLQGRVVGALTRLDGPLFEFRGFLGTFAGFWKATVSFTFVYTIFRCVSIRLLKCGFVRQNTTLYFTVLYYFVFCSYMFRPFSAIFRLPWRWCAYLIYILLISTLY
jgi:hypothetical protein